MAEQKKADSKKALGFWRTWSLSAGYMIGSGIFVMPTFLAPYGLLGLSSWLITGAGAVLLALVLANMTRRIPKVGGPYAYAREAFGDFAGFIIAWSYWISLWVATATIAVAMVGYLGVFIPALEADFIKTIAAGLLVIAALVGLNIVGIRQSSIFQLVLTILKIIPLLAIGIAGLFYIDAGNIPELNPSGEPPLAVLAAGAILTMWAFVGLEAATIPAGDVKNPTKTIPRVLVTAVLSVVVIYFLSSFAVMGIMDGATLAESQAPFADAAISMWGGWAGYAIAAGAIISTLGALNCSVLLAGQMPMAAALNGLFPAPFGKMSKSNTPATGLVIGGVLGGALIILNYTRGFVDAITFMAVLSTLATVMAYAFSALADFKMSLRDETLSAFRKSKNLIVAVLAFGFSMFLVYGSGIEVFLYGALMIFAGVPFYIYLTKFKK